MGLWAALPFLAQGALMLADERFHLRRGLPAWERWGHPVDTFLMAACYALALFAPRTPAGLAVYAGTAALSCLCVTKDEWVHARHCRGSEHWLHAVLFLLHPVLLGLAGIWAFAGLLPGRPSLAGHGGFGAFLRVQALLTVAFGIWQAAYWNGPWGRSRPVRTNDRIAADPRPETGLRGARREDAQGQRTGTRISRGGAADPESDLQAKAGPGERESGEAKGAEGYRMADKESEAA